MNDEQRRAILGDAVYEQVRREAREAAEQAPPFTEEQVARLRAIFQTSPKIPARRIA